MSLKVSSLTIYMYTVHVQIFTVRSTRKCTWCTYIIYHTCTSYMYIIGKYKLNIPLTAFCSLAWLRQISKYVCFTAALPRAFVSFSAVAGATDMDDESVVFEPTLDCVIKMGQFEEQIAQNWLLTYSKTYIKDRLFDRTPIYNDHHDNNKAWFIQVWAIVFLERTVDREVLLLIWILPFVNGRVWRCEFVIWKKNTVKLWSLGNWGRLLLVQNWNIQLSHHTLLWR